MDEPIKTFWVKKEITNKEWIGDYSQRGDSYRKFGETGEGKARKTVIVFLAAMTIPNGCVELTREEYEKFITAK